MGTPWRAQGVRTSIVHRYWTVERPVEPCRVLSCQISVPTGTRHRTRYGTTGSDEPRLITRLSRISVRLIYGLIRDHRAP